MKDKTLIKIGEYKSSKVYLYCSDPFNEGITYKIFIDTPEYASIQSLRDILDGSISRRYPKMPEIVEMLEWGANKASQYINLL